LVAGGIVLLCLFLLLNIIIQAKKRAEGLITYEVKREDLLVSVIEGGDLKALRSQKIVNEVPGQRAILEVIDEGTVITDQDVQDSKILMKLDSKDLEDRIEELKINVENSWSSYIQAQQNLEIQKKQNESDIKQAELKVKFAKIDFEKYLGKDLVAKLIETKELNFPQLIENPELAGEALNRKRELENQIDLAKEEVARAQDTLGWSEKLADKEYLTKSELEADKFSLQQKEASIENAKLEYQLFLNYDFPKQVEELLSDYEEALSELDRTKARCESEIIKYETDVNSKKATYLERKNNLDDTEEDLANCTITATQPGLVTYATSSRPWQSQDPIQPGTNVRNRQELLNIPDLNTMGVEVRIHESSIKQIKVDQKVIVKVDAVPDKIFTGKVKKVSPLPDAIFKWMNPDINVYLVEISLDETSEFSKLTPGMSAEVEIEIERLKDVLAVPLAAVSFDGDKSFCTVVRGRRISARQVELGSSNNEMVEIRKGLKEGELIVMLPGKMGYQIQKVPQEEKGRFQNGQSGRSGS
jgi:HlyD family secretion protein